MGHPTIEAYHGAQTQGDRAICNAPRAGIDGGLPEAEAKMWHAHPVWFLAGNPITGYSKLKTCVRLLFWSGQSFQTPGLTASGTFKAAEVRLTDMVEVAALPLADWLDEARNIQWDYKNIVRRQGRLERLV